VADRPTWDERGFFCGYRLSPWINPNRLLSTNHLLSTLGVKSGKDPGIKSKREGEPTRASLLALHYTGAQSSPPFYSFGFVPGVPCMSLLFKPHSSVATSPPVVDAFCVAHNRLEPPRCVEKNKGSAGKARRNRKKRKNERPIDGGKGYFFKSIVHYVLTSTSALPP